MCVQVTTTSWPPPLWRLLPLRSQDCVQGMPDSYLLPIYLMPLPAHPQSPT